MHAQSVYSYCCENDVVYDVVVFVAIVVVGFKWSTQPWVAICILWIAFIWIFSQQIIFLGKKSPNPIYKFLQCRAVSGYPIFIRFYWHNFSSPYFSTCNEYCTALIIPHLETKEKWTKNGKLITYYACMHAFNPNKQENLIYAPFSQSLSGVSVQFVLHDAFEKFFDGWFLSIGLFCMFCGL